MPERRRASDVRPGRVAAHRDRRDDDDEGCDRHCDEDARQPCGARDAAQIGGGQHRDRGECRGAAPPLRSGHHVRPERQRHRRTRGRLSDDEAEPRQEPPPLAQALAAVHVRAARRRVLDCELRRRNRVAVRHGGREDETDEQGAARRRSGRRERREHACADHRAEPDHDRVGRAEPAGEGRARRHIAAATRRAAAASSSSVTFGSTSSHSGSIIPAASTIPSGRGRNQTWKCAPPSPQR